MTRSRVYLGVVAVLLATLAGLAGWAQWAVGEAARAELPAQRQLAAALMLTDLALWTEARYTRHPSMADQFSPFQDHPAGFEHFPAGALLAPVAPRPETILGVRRHRPGPS